MFKKFIIGLMATLMVTQPAFAGRYSSGRSFSSSRSFSSGSSFRSGGFSSGSSYRPSSSYRSSYGSSYSRPAATAPRFSSGSSYNTSRPAQTRVVSRPRNSYYGGGYNQPAANNNNHYYGGGGFGGGYGGGGFGSSFGGAFTGSMLGNMIFGNHQQAPVIVNGGGYAAPQGGMAPGGYDQQMAPVDNVPGFFGMIFWGLVNLLTLGIFIAALAWIFVKIRNFIRNRK